MGALIYSPLVHSSQIYPSFFLLQCLLQLIRTRFPLIRQHKHISIISTRASRMSSIILCGTVFMKQIFVTYIRSLLNFCSVQNTGNIENIESLEAVPSRQMATLTCHTFIQSFRLNICSYQQIYKNINILVDLLLMTADEGSEALNKDEFLYLRQSSFS